jgi:hypothetical protein
MSTRLALALSTGCWCSGSLRMRRDVETGERRERGSEGAAGGEGLDRTIYRFRVTFQAELGAEAGALEQLLPQAGLNQGSLSSCCRAACLTTHSSTASALFRFDTSTAASSPPIWSPSSSVRPKVLGDDARGAEGAHVEAGKHGQEERVVRWKVQQGGEGRDDHLLLTRA